MCAICAPHVRLVQELLGRTPILLPVSPSIGWNIWNMYEYVSFSLHVFKHCEMYPFEDDIPVPPLYSTSSININQLVFQTIVVHDVHPSDEPQ